MGHSTLNQCNLPKNVCLPCDGCVCDEFCDDNDGRYGGRLIFDRILTDDELRLFELLSPADDGESFIFDEAEFACLYI